MIVLSKLDTTSDMYSFALESYKKIYNNIMSKGKIDLTPKFLGGNPITFEKKDIPMLFKKQYMVSAKANGGIRFLLMIGGESEIYKDKQIFFVDKNMAFWNITNLDLPGIKNISQILLDGELIVEGENNNINGEIRGKKLIYSSFDILYGPTNPKFDEIYNYSTLGLELGSSAAMLGPKGGLRWPWFKRYNILKILVNNKYSSLNKYINLNNVGKYINITVSPFIKLENILLDENLNIRSFIDFKNYMNEKFKKSMKKQLTTTTSKNIYKTNGLILTPYDTEYISGQWSFCGNKVFKWNQESVNFKILKFLYKNNMGKIIEDYNNFNPTMKDQILDQIGTLEFRSRCLMYRDPINIFSWEDGRDLKFMIQDALKFDGNVELESRIIFENNRLPYFSCLVNKIFKNSVEQTPTLKIYENRDNGTPGNRRVSYALLGNHKALSENIDKIVRRRLKIKQSDMMKVANYNIKEINMVFSDEIVRFNNPLINNPSYRHQIRYEVNGSQPDFPSILWRLDITQFGQSRKSPEDAKLNYIKNPKTSIELEYSPGDQENKEWQYYLNNPTPQLLEQIIIKFNLNNSTLQPQQVRQMLDDRIDRLKNLSYETIFNDYCRLIVWICDLVYN